MASHSRSKKRFKSSVELDLPASEFEESECTPSNKSNVKNQFKKKAPKQKNRKVDSDFSKKDNKKLIESVKLYPIFASPTSSLTNSKNDENSNKGMKRKKSLVKSCDKSLKKSKNLSTKHDAIVNEKKSIEFKLSDNCKNLNDIQKETLEDCKLFPIFNISSSPVDNYNNDDLQMSIVQSINLEIKNNGIENKSKNKKIARLSLENTTTENVNNGLKKIIEPSEGNLVRRSQRHKGSYKKCLPNGVEKSYSSKSPVEVANVRKDIDKIITSKTKASPKTPVHGTHKKMFIKNSSENFNKLKPSSKPLVSEHFFPIFAKTAAVAIKNKSILQLNAQGKKKNQISKMISKIKTKKSKKSEMKIKSNLTDISKNSCDEDQSAITLSQNVRRSARCHKPISYFNVEEEIVEDIEVFDKSTKKNRLAQDEEDLVIICNVKQQLEKGTKCTSLLKKSKEVSVLIRDSEIKNNDKWENKSKLYSAVETELPYALISHCDQSDNVETTDVLCKFIEKENEGEVKVPIWNSVIGLTEVKNFDDLAQFPDEVIQTHDLEMPNKLGDVLWTDSINEHIGNHSIMEELQNWLSQWKSRLSNQKRVKINDDSSLDSFSDDSNDSFSDDLSNSILITGRPGSGKTSLVYSLANKLGFKVLEVNASSCRSGKIISHQLREALESYHVENTNEDRNIAKKDILRMTHIPKPRIEKLHKGIASFFKSKSEYESMSDNTRKSNSNKGSFEIKSKSKKGDKECSTVDAMISKDYKNTSCRISGQTIILFDDVDIIFEEDEGFWSTIRSFLKISKKPVIFTASRSLGIIKENFNDEIKILQLESTCEKTVMDILNMQCKNFKNINSFNLQFLCKKNSNDIRRSLLLTQFWSVRTENFHLKSNAEPNFHDLILGSLPFNSESLKSTILDKSLNTSSSFLYESSKCGYDLLHTNLYMLHGLNCPEKQWNKIIESRRLREKESTELNDLWQEACMIFNLKKDILKRGSSSVDLHHLSSLLEDWSYAESLKGYFVYNKNWSSTSERLKEWTMGLPTYQEELYSGQDDIILTSTSYIQVLKFKLYKQELKGIFIKKTIDELYFEHPFVGMEDSVQYRIENQLNVLNSLTHTGQCLNKRYLNLDYLDTLKTICHFELGKQSKSSKRSNRFLHYFDSISLYIDRKQIEDLLYL